jgi:dethiobiotin synthetase
VTAYFVTATGTGIGKTFVTAGLIRHLRARGRPVDALKPVISGFDATDAGTSDTGVLLRALGRDVVADEIARLSPWRFRAPLAPNMAAPREGRVLDVNALIAFTRRAADENHGVLLIEGVGGIMVPLDERQTMLDWMDALRLPLILVTGSYLGAISHTLTAVEVLMHRDLKIAALVVSETPDSTVTLEDTVATVKQFLPSVEVVPLPWAPDAEAAHPALAGLADRL